MHSAGKKIRTRVLFRVTSESMKYNALESECVYDVSGQFHTDLEWFCLFTFSSVFQLFQCLAIAKINSNLKFASVVFFNLAAKCGLFCRSMEWHFSLLCFRPRKKSA